MENKILDAALCSETKNAWCFKMRGFIKPKWVPKSISLYDKTSQKLTIPIWFIDQLSSQQRSYKTVTEDELANLHPYHKEALYWMAKGYDTSTIAEMMGLSKASISARHNKIRSKFNLVINSNLILLAKKHKKWLIENVQNRKLSEFTERLSYRHESILDILLKEKCITSKDYKKAIKERKKRDLELNLKRYD
jgi:DNA-binding CsgD family transcriptional regulator